MLKRYVFQTDILKLGFILQKKQLKNLFLVVNPGEVYDKLH
jgi:hypothetical protein